MPNEELKKKVLDKIKENEGLATKLTKDFVAIDTTNPPGNEYLLAKVIQERFDEKNIEYKTFEKEKGRTNLVAYIGNKGPKVMISCHMDVVPAGEGWHTPPFEAVEKEGKLYGRGVVDNKGPLASLVVLTEVLKEFEEELPFTLCTAIVADEEKGSKLGLEYLVEEKLIDIDYAIIPDTSGNLKEIEIAEKGVLWVKLKVIGKQAHGSRPDYGINSIEKMVNAINELKQKLDLSEEHDELGKATMNIGIIKGGSAPNMVPGLTELTIDFRYLPCQSEELIVKRIKDVLDKIEINYEIEILENQLPSEVSKDAPVIKAIQKACQEFKNYTPEFKGIGGATVGKFLNLNGITAVGFSAGHESQPHMANEYIEIKEIEDAVPLFALSLFNCE